MVDPHNLLASVHPDLVRVILAAEQTPQPFVVTYGIRTLAAEQAAVAAGHSQTLHSRHLPQAGQHGLACAIDFTCYENGEPVETGPRVQPVYSAAAEQILAAAKRLGIPVQWGGQPIGAWVPGVVSHFHDWGHVQLPWAQYP